MRSATRLAQSAAVSLALLIYARASLAGGGAWVDAAATPPWLAAAFAVALAWGLCRVGDAYPALRAPLALCAYAAAPLAAWSVLQRPLGADWQAETDAQHADLIFIPVVLLTGLVLAIGHTLGGLLRDRFRGVDKRLVGDLLAVTGWSYFVRLALTTPNILTDGGSGYRRLQEFMPGMSGLSMMLDLLRGGRVAEGDMWAAMTLPIVISASAPAAVVLLGRALGFERRTAALAGFMLASLPLHAALYTSDFLTGSAMALTTFGLAALVHAVNTERWQWLWFASAVLAFSILIRPEAILIGVGVVAFGRAGWRALLRPIAAIPTAYLGGVALLVMGLLLRSAGAPGTAMGSMPPVLPYAAWITDQRILPLWFSASFPLGFFVLLRGGLLNRGTLIAFALTATVAAIPAIRFAGDSDPAGAPMEWPRYGTWFMPWAILTAAAGLVWLCDRVSKRIDAQSLLVNAPYWAMTAVVVATPLMAADYLASEYGYRRDEPVFRRALAQVPTHCTLVVPDDASETQSGGSIEIVTRYELIALEAAAAEKPAVRILGITRASERLRSDDIDAGDCWYLYKGAFCYIGLRGAGTSVCDNFLANIDAEPVLSERINYRDHRLIVRPDLSESGLIVDDMELTLYRFKPRT